MKRALAAVFMLSMLLLGAPHAARAQSAIDVTSTNAEISFPQGITFTLDVTVSGTLDDVRIDYQIAPDGVRTTAVPQCTSGQAVHCTFRFANSQSNPLIPGGVVTYSWSLTSGGQTQDTPSQTVTYMDTRYDWKTVSDGNLTLWYYSGSESDARAVLKAGRESIDQTSALINTHVEIPLKIFYYDTAEEMQPAIVANNAPGVITLGEVVYSDTAMVSRDYSPKDIARHEVAHIVQRTAMAGPYSHNEPDWLNEGTAVYAQTQPLQDQRDAIGAAIRTGDVISVRSMSSASSGASSNTVSLFYGEAWSLTKFLIDTYGQEKFAQLFVALKTGSTTGRALQQVYGFDEDGFENAWRASNGLPPRTPVATAAPTPQLTATATHSSSDGSSGKPLGLIAGVILATIIIAGGLLGLGVVLARRL
jgi:hypothetical protein